MYQENQYNYDNSSGINSYCDICGLSFCSRTGMENGLCLCEDCSCKMVLMDDGMIKDSITKFAMGNVV